MTRSRSLPLALGALLLIPAALWTSRFYAVPDPWGKYDAALRAYLAAAVQGDSAALGRHAASAQPVAWVLEAADRHRELVSAWAEDLAGVTGERRGDTVAVVLSAPDVEGCARAGSVSALFLDHSAAPRLLAIGSACVDRHVLRVLRSRPITDRVLAGSR
jgi:hypothetical protein